MSLLEKATLITTPTAYGNGTLHSIKGGAVADFDVVRGSAATRVNAEGIIEDISVLSGELITNGDFATDVSGWSGNTTKTWNNGTLVSVGSGALNNTNVQTLNLTAGKTYRFTWEILSTDGSGSFIFLSTDGQVTNSYVGVGTFTEDVTLASSSTYVDFRFSGANATTIFNSLSVVEVIDATNIPRIDYTTGEGVVLLEPQSTNLVVNSELNNVENIVVSAVSHTISFYGTGSITLSGAHTATLSGTGANDRVSLTFTPSAGTLTCTDSGSVDMKQLEALPYATSYIPTSGAIASRLADSVTGAGDATTFNSTEGVLYAEIAALREINDNAQFLSLGSGSYTNNSVYLQLRAAPNQFAVWAYSNNLNQLADVFTVADITDYNKIAISYKLNDFKVYVNGSVAYTNTSYIPPTANSLNTLDFARDGSNAFYGKAKALAVFNEALTDSELECLTKI